MITINTDLRDNPFVIKENQTLERALKEISVNQNGQIIVLDEKNTVIGVLSDGDIRRALLRESSKITPVNKLMNVNFTVIRTSDEQEPEEVFCENEEVMIIPEVNQRGELVRIHAKNNPKE